MMETEEICSVTISSLVVNKFTTQWSEDNHLSIITEQGVYVFELLPAPTTFQTCMRFSRSFIYAPNTIPGESIAINAADWVCNREREELYSLLMEGYLTPKMEEMIDLVPRIVNVAWSPQTLMYSNKCLLAILTSAGAVHILHKLYNEWYPVYDITAFYSETRVEETPPRKYRSVELYKDRIYDLQGTAIVWSELMDQFAYFTVIYRNGSIVIYKIPKIFDTNNIPPPEIVLKRQLALKSKVMIVQWVTVSPNEFLLLVGYFDGCLQGVWITNTGGDLRILSVETYCDIADRIPINDLTVLSKKENEINILICKGTILFLMQVEKEGSFKSSQPLRLKAFSVSGICSLGNSQTLILTEDGLMWMVDVCAGQLRVKAVKNSLANTQSRYLGLTHSTNRAFFVTTTSPNTTYDHLVVKEPTKVYFFTFTSEEYGPLKLFETYKSVRCERLWDCFELLRIKAAKDQKSTFSFPSQFSHFNGQSLDELRITMWMTILAEVCSKKQAIRDSASLLNEPSEVQSIIFILTISNYLERLAKKSALSEEEKTAINSLRLYLEVYLAGEENTEVSFIAKRAREIYDKTHDLALKKIETCNICGSSLKGLPWKTNNCPDGHILPRCTVTFLQLTDVNCKICQTCNLTFHPCLDEEKESGRCPYCDLPLVTDNRILNLKALQDKSLSRPRGGLTSGLESEMDQD